MFGFLFPSVLVEQLRGNKLPTRPVLILVSINICFQCLSGQPGFFSYRAFPSLLPFLILHLGIGLASLWLGYQANGGSQGRDFFGRFMVVSTVLYFWVWIMGYIALTLVSWAFYYLVGPYTFEYFKQLGVGQLVFASIASLVYLFSIQHLLARIRQSSSD